MIRYARGLGFDPLWDNKTTDNDKDLIFDARTTKSGAYSPTIASVVYGVPTTGKDASEDQSVIIHELGHALHDALLIGGLPNYTFTDLKGISEGISDYLSIDYRRQLSYYRPNDRCNWYNPLYEPTIIELIDGDEASFYYWNDYTDRYIRMRMWASSLMDLEYNLATDPAQGYRLGREVVTTLQLASLSYLTQDNDRFDNVLAMYQADIDIYDG
ncbi:MAG: hypothetical protein KKD38_06745, partial [Candidatus Delongbacteria bacterium]|nr:hypothetical protein [Candidatus Delongbacteria bacterium]